MVFKESGLEFIFNDEFWEPIIQYDEQPDYKRIKNSLTGTKAVDFIGCFKSDIYFFEVKSFKNYRIENKYRVNNLGEELMTEVAQKVRDSLAGIVGGYRMSKNDKELWIKILNKIRNEKIAIKVILWWERERNSIENNTIRKQNKKARDKVALKPYKDKLRQKLEWLVPKNGHVKIFSLEDYDHNIEMTVCNLPDKGT